MMRQALHIFAKDIRYLRYELFLVVSLAAIFAWMAARHVDTTWVQILLPFAETYLIVRLIHAEAIPGDTQFWITRPYRWMSLAAEKVLFILVFVELPLFVVQFVILVAEEFPLADYLPGLLWTQVLMVLTIWLPVAAIAAMTRSLVSFLFSVLALFAVAFSTQEMIFLSGIAWRWRMHLAQWPISIDWMRTTIMGIALVVIALPVLYVQYRRRRSIFSRTYASGAAVLTLAAYTFVPWQLAMAVESHLSKNAGAGSKVQVALGEISKNQGSPRGRGVEVNMYLPIAVRGFAAGTEVQGDALAVTITTADGREWKSPVNGVNLLTSSADSAKFEGTIPVDTDFYNRERKEPVNVRATLYMTLFGNPRSATIPLRKKPVNVMDGLQCFVGDIFDHLYCRSAFRWPDRLVYAYTTPINQLPVYPLISYSPFPSGIGMDDAIEAHWTEGAVTGATEVKIVVKEPLAHLERTLEARGIRMADFARHQ